MIFEKEPQALSVSVNALRHAVYLPPEYDADPDKKWPLLVFLHGAGERGNDYTGLWRHGPLREVREGREFPFVIVAPQIEAPHYWGCYSETLNSMLDGWLHDYRVDPARVYLTGLSMGGTGTWMWGMANPERFAAIAPVCGSGIGWCAGNLKDVPVWTFHGDQDKTVYYSDTVQMVERLQALGGNVRFTTCEGYGHDCWTDTYHREDVYEWLLAQHK